MVEQSRRNSNRSRAKHVVAGEESMGNLFRNDQKMDWITEEEGLHHPLVVGF